MKSLINEGNLKIKARFYFFLMTFGFTFVFELIIKFCKVIITSSFY